MPDDKDMFHQPTVKQILAAVLESNKKLDKIIALLEPRDVTSLEVSVDKPAKQ